MFTQENYEILLEHFRQRDFMIYQIMKKHGYVKPPPQRNIFAVLIGSIIGQRIRFTKARQLRGKLYTCLGTDDFTPDDILNLGQDGLLSLGMSQIQSDVIMRVTNHIINEQILLNPEQIRELGSVKGIGPWTINCTNLMFSLNEDDDSFDDLLLDTDLIIKRGIKALYANLNKSQMAEVVENWKPHRGIVTWYIWKEFT